MTTQASHEKIKQVLNSNMVEQVAFTNDTFGNNLMKLTEENADEFWEKVVAQAKLILEEAQEVYDFAVARNFNLVRDNTSDVLVTALGMPHRFGFDVEADMLEVTKSNLSKVCPDMADAEATVQKYQKIGVGTYIEPCPTFEGFIVKVSETVVGTDGKEYPKGKFLKSVGNYVEPYFE